jgi:LytS/YehU family sensor histidine kinase
MVTGAWLLKIITPVTTVFRHETILGHLVNLSVFIILTSSIKFYREFVFKREKLIHVENEQLKLVISLLKSQVHPHFLFNTLNNLYGLILAGKNESAAQVTLKLSDLMRYMLASNHLEQVSLRSEVDFINNYLELEKIRLSHKQDIRFTISGLQTDVLVPPMLFIPLIENAFKHGLQKFAHNGFAHFLLSIQAKEIYFEAENSVGLNSSAITTSGTGLDNLRKRLTLLFPDKHLLEIEANETTFKATLQISL